MSHPGWLRGLRRPFRAAVFGFAARFLETEDGKRLVVDAVNGRTSGSPFRCAAGDLRQRPYPDLGPFQATSPASVPIFVSARFRSGSTLLWNIFRHVAGCTAYYEPLNERRWFDPATRGSRVDATHVGVSQYWREYEGLEHLSQWYRERWIDQHLYMDEDFWEPDLKAYFQALIEAAPGRPALQCNRIDFRLPWIRRTFPGARIIHLYRHPREQWCSTLVDADLFPRTGTAAEFEAHDHFYLLAWARDLSYRFPFLNAARVRHPYQLFYLIWRLSYLFGRRYAHGSFSYEDLASRPEREIPRLMAAAEVDRYDLDGLRQLIEVKPRSRWPEYADADWFAEHETECEAVLAEFFDLRVGQPSEELEAAQRA